MSVHDAVRVMQNETEWQKTREWQQLIKDSTQPGASRNVNGAMGKNDFLKLLAAQLRYQNPLEPTSDADFASQLAQFSSLEQMQNMNEALSAMMNYQAFSLVGKTVVAQAEVEGALTNITGVVDSIFTRDGMTFAVLYDGAYEYTVPIGTIMGVFDSGTSVTPDMLIQTSNNLIGRTVVAQVGDDTFEGVVTRVKVDGGFMFALITSEDGEETFVPVGAIFDIRQTAAPAETEPVEPTEPEDKGNANIIIDPDDGDYGQGDGGDDNLTADP